MQLTKKTEIGTNLTAGFTFDPAGEAIWTILTTPTPNTIATNNLSGGAIAGIVIGVIVVIAIIIVVVVLYIMGKFSTPSFVS